MAHVPEVAHLLVDEILEAAGGANYAVDAPAQRVLLRRLRHAAVYDRGRHVHDLAEFLQHLLGLHGKLARGGQHEHAGCPAGRVR